MMRRASACGMLLALLTACSDATSPSGSQWYVGTWNTVLVDGAPAVAQNDSIPYIVVHLELDKSTGLFKVDQGAGPGLSAGCQQRGDMTASGGTATFTPPASIQQTQCEVPHTLTRNGAAMTVQVSGKVFTLKRAS